MDEEEAVGHIEREVKVLVTIHGRSEWYLLKDALDELSAEILEQVLLEAVHYVQEKM